MKKNIHIEGYLFLPFNGQCRFSFDLLPRDEGYAVTPIKTSERAYDYFWDSTMRGRPTLYELLDPNEVVARNAEQFHAAIFNLFFETQAIMLKVPNMPFRKMLPGILPRILRHDNDGYVEFVNVKYHY